MLDGYLDKRGITYNAPLEDTIGDDRIFGFRVLMSEAHECVVVDSVVDASHHALIITKEEDGQGRHAVDRYEKITFPQTVDDIEPVDVLHRGGSSRSCIQYSLLSMRGQGYWKSWSEAKNNLGSTRNF